MSSNRFVEASKLVMNNIKAKFGDDLLIGMEHTRRISANSVLPITQSKIEIKQYRYQQKRNWRLF